jgi:hypothetical protein
LSKAIRGCAVVGCRGRAVRLVQGRCNRLQSNEDGDPGTEHERDRVCLLPYVVLKSPCEVRQSQSVTS